MQLYAYYDDVLNKHHSNEQDRWFNPAFKAVLDSFIFGDQGETQMELIIVGSTTNNLISNIIQKYEEAIAERNKRPQIASAVKTLLENAIIENTMPNEIDGTQIFFFGHNNSQLSEHVNKIDGKLINYIDRYDLRPDPDIEKQIEDHQGPIHILLDIDNTIFCRELTRKHKVCMANDAVASLVGECYNKNDDVRAQVITRRKSFNTLQQEHRNKQLEAYGISGFQETAALLKDALDKLDTSNESDHLNETLENIVLHAIKSNNSNNQTITSIFDSEIIEELKLKLQEIDRLLHNALIELDESNSLDNFKKAISGADARNDITEQLILRLIDNEVKAWSKQKKPSYPVCKPFYFILINW